MTICDAIKTKTGSFRGVEFHYESGSVSGGRRGATHEYPFREEHYDEDLGKRAERFSISGYVTQPDVRDQLRRLQNAFEAPGHGIYYEAWLNRDLTVRCEEFSIDLGRSDKSTGFFTATFVERGAEAAPTAIRRAIAQLFGFLSQFNEALATGHNLITGTISDIEAAVDGFSSAGSYFSFAYKRNFAASGAAVTAITKFDSTNPVNSPEAIADVENGFDAVLSVLPDGKDLEFLDTVSAISIEGGVEYKAQELLFAGVALSRYGELVISRSYQDRETAISELNNFVRASRRYSRLAESLGQPALAESAMCLASLAGGRVSTELGDVPFTKKYDGQGLPALVMSYELFGDIDSADQIRVWNNSVTGASLVGDIGYVVSDFN